MTWRLQRRDSSYGAGETRCEWRGDVPVAICGADAAAIVSWEAGIPRWEADSLTARFDVAANARALLAFVAAHAEPLVLPGRSAVEQRLKETIEFWTGWTKNRQYDGPWPDAVLRSALVLKALIFAPSGASVAAPTTSLPETDRRRAQLGLPLLLDPRLQFHHRRPARPRMF